MGTFSVHFDTDNDAFLNGDGGYEIARILSVIAEKIRDESSVSGRVYDINGNQVGQFDWVQQ